MIDLAAPHVGFVLWCYAVAALLLIGIAAHTLWRSAKLRKTLADLKLPDVGQRDRP
jgi:heme exporter protein CcmD